MSSIVDPTMRMSRVGKLKRDGGLDHYGAISGLKGQNIVNHESKGAVGRGIQHVYGEDIHQH